MLIWLLPGFFLVVILFYLFMIMPNRSRRHELMPFLGMSYAHRGLHDAQNLIPENSMSAFKSAVKQSLAIELDIHLTKDNQVVVFHDDSLKRICHSEGTIENSTYDELKRLHLLGTSERIPLFSEVLEYVNGRVPLLIELKLPSRNMKLCFYTWELLKNYRGPFLVQSFNSLGIRWFSKNAPQVLRGQLSSALTRTNPDDPFWARFLVQHLLTNICCRPDFISYKMADSHNLSLWLNQNLFRAPIAVWTLRDIEIYASARRQFDMYIFEGFSIKG